MKPKTVILLGVAIVCGLMAAYLVSMATSKSTEVKIPVAVAARDIPQGTLITNVDELFKSVQMDKETVPLGAVSMDDPAKAKERLQGKIMKSTLGTGQVITDGALDDYKGIQKELKDNQRAMTVRVTLDTAVSGFVLPGATVDLLCTVVNPNTGLKVSKIFLQNMRVLAVGQTDVRPETTKAMAAPSVVTFAVTPEEAERLNWIASQAMVTMVLRKPEDKEKKETEGATSPFEEKKKDGEGSKNATVVVAKTNVDKGTKIEDARLTDLFEIKTIPTEGVVVKEPLKSLDDLKGQVLSRDVTEGQIVTKAHCNGKVAGPDDPPAPGQQQTHVMSIFDGSKPVMKITFVANAPAGAGREEGPPPGPAPKGPAPKGPGSEGK